MSTRPASTAVRTHGVRVGLPALLVLGACVRAKSAVPANTAPPDASVVATAARQPNSDRVGNAGANGGRLQVVVRPADRPTQSLPEAQVLLRLGQRDSLMRLTDDRGIASFDSLEVGDYDMVVRRIGYAQARATILIKAGCRTGAEAYIAAAVIGIDPPPPLRGRVTITTC